MGSTMTKGRRRGRVRRSRVTPTSTPRPPSRGARPRASRSRRPDGRHGAADVRYHADARVVEDDRGRRSRPDSSKRTGTPRPSVASAPDPPRLAVSFERGHVIPAGAGRRRRRGPEEGHGVSTTGHDRPPDLPPRARLRQLRRRRIGAGVLRHGRERAGSVRADGPGLGGRHQLLRHRRRLRRRAQRDLHRPLAEAEGSARARPAPPQLEGVQPGRAMARTIAASRAGTSCGRSTRA